jgi:protein gp37
MAEGSAIEWTDHTFNPWIGCTKVGPGCDNCYAEVLMDKRHHRVQWGGDRSRTSASTWAMPVKWERAAAAFMAKHGRRQRVFCSSLADVFDNHRSIEPHWRLDLADLILRTPSLDWLLLTKRIGNALDMLIEMFPNGVPANVRVGATIVNQAEWDRDRRKIAQVFVACQQKPFLSMEPLRWPVNLETDPAWKRYIGWVIVGGESGHGARTMHPDWVVGIHDQCARGQVPFLFKQWGEHLPHVVGPEEPDSIRFAPGHVIYNRVGKKAAGRKLFGVEHNGFPA